MEGPGQHHSRNTVDIDVVIRIVTDTLRAEISAQYNTHENMLMKIVSGKLNIVQHRKFRFKGQNGNRLTKNS